jgi:uncharacterized SAM-binding protein YcdF (DUF218 family)
MQKKNQKLLLQKKYFTKRDMIETNVWIEKMRLSTFENNRKSRRLVGYLPLVRI